MAVRDSRTRDSHRALHGKVFPHDSEFWDVWYPPNGFNCRCRVRALTEDQVRRRKLKVEKDFELPEIQRQVGIDRATGEVIRRPVRGFRGRDAAGRPIAITPHEGFDYNPGKDWPRWDPINDKTPRGVRWIPDEDKDKSPTWKDYGLKTAEEEKWSLTPQPEMKPEASSLKDALDVLAGAVLGRKKTKIIHTPVEDMAANRGLLVHTVEDRVAARERYANFMLPTLEDPDEVWLVLHEEVDRVTGKVAYSYRKQYLKVFAGKDARFVGIAREGLDGTTVWTFFKSTGKGKGKWKYLNKQRRGALLYKRKG